MEHLYHPMCKQLNDTCSTERRRGSAVNHVVCYRGDFINPYTPKSIICNTSHSKFTAFTKALWNLYHLFTRYMSLDTFNITCSIIYVWFCYISLPKSGFITLLLGCALSFSLVILHM